MDVAARGPLALRSRARVTSPAPREVWWQLAASDADALVFQTPPWIDALCANGGYRDASRLYEAPSGNRLLLPLVRRSRRAPGGLAPLASMPRAWGMGGLISDRPPSPEDMEAVVDDLARLPALAVRIRPNPLHGDRWSAATRGRAVAVPSLAHVLDLEGGEEAVWNERFGKQARRDVRKATSAGVEIECDTTGRLIPVFYELLCKSVERWAQRQNEPLALARWRARRRHPLEKLQGIAARLGEACEVWMAWHERRPVASLIVLRGANASDTRGAMDRSLAAPTRANGLLQWMAIRSSCRAGCRWYHMGESAPGSTLAYAKEKYGARPVSYATLHFERLPLTRADALARATAKRLIRFRDA